MKLAGSANSDLRKYASSGGAENNMKKPPILKHAAVFKTDKVSSSNAFA